MRESALFLLGLLVAVSVDVARLLVCADLCERGHTRVGFVGRWNVWREPTTKGGATDLTGGIPASMDLFFRFAMEKLHRYLATIRSCQPDRIVARCSIFGIRISIRRALRGRVLFQIAVCVCTRMYVCVRVCVCVCVCVCYVGNFS